MAISTGDEDLRHLAMSSTDVERACEFIVTAVDRRAGHRARQGRRLPPLACRSTSPVVRFFAEHRLCGVPTAVARALLAWADGFSVVLLTRVPSPFELLELQAVGRRCVSLLPDHAEVAPHANTLDFALHDLCHLDKFADPEHHLGQVGFFAGLRAASARTEWSAFQAELDSVFQRDVAQVAADMNGSAVFLFAALKMKLKMAVRRRCNAELHRAKVSGPLDEAELKRYQSAEDELFALLGFGVDVAAAARATSTRRGDLHAAMKLLAHFEDAGRRVQAAQRRAIDSHRAMCP
jgi:hypothetical protein